MFTKIILCILCILIGNLPIILINAVFDLEPSAIYALMITWGMFCGWNVLPRLLQKCEELGL